MLRSANTLELIDAPSEGNANLRWPAENGILTTITLTAALLESEQMALEAPTGDGDDLAARIMEVGRYVAGTKDLNRFWPQLLS